MKITSARFARTVVAVVMAAVAVSILLYVLGHRRQPTVVPPKVQELTEKKVERQEGIEHLVYRGSRTIQVKAPRHYAGDDGRNHLEGGVEVRQLGKEGEEQILLVGQKATYDRDWTEAVLEGGARLRYGKLTVESERLTYHDETGILATESGVAFSSGNLSGRANRMDYSFTSRVLNLEGDVEIRELEPAESAAPLVIRTNALTYSREEKRGRAQGGVSFEWEQSAGRGESVEFSLTPDEKYFHEVFLRGGVTFTLVEKEPAPVRRKSLLLASARSREITAGEVSLRAFLNEPKIHAVEAAGGCVLRSRPPDGGLLEVSSLRMRFVFDRWGGLREFWAVGGARLTEQSKDKSSGRIMTGEEIFVGELGERLSLKAAQGGEARLESAEVDLTAAEVVFIPRTERVDAAGDVKALLKFPPESGGDVAFFSREQPVFAAAGRVRFDPSEKRFYLRGQARMWQERKTISAEDVIVSTEKGEMSATGGVRTAIPFVPKKEEPKEERLELGGGRLSFDPDKRELTYEEGAWLKTQSISVNSASILVRIQKDKGEVESVTAEGSVRVAAGSREGSGGRAFYEIAKETVTLTGSPSLIDKEKGKVEGDKLTFYLSDGRILVENKERERSVTVLKF